MSKNSSLIFLIIFVMLLAAANVTAVQMEDVSAKHIVWGNMPIMYFIDFVIIASAIFAIYTGQHMLSGELKSAFMYIFAGIGLISIGYILDLYAMATGNIALMDFIHLDLIWVINAIAFISIVAGFHKMDKLFHKITQSHLNKK